MSIGCFHILSAQMWLLGCGPTCCVPFVIWSVQAAPVSASNTLLGSNKMLKATTDREARLSASERKGLKGTRRRNKKGSWREIKDRQEESWTAERGDVAPGAWGPTEDPKAMRFKLCCPVIQAIELLNVTRGKSRYNEKWSLRSLGRALKRCCLFLPRTLPTASLSPSPRGNLCVTSFYRGRPWCWLFFFFFFFFKGRKKKTLNAHRENANDVQLRFIVRRDTGG